MHELGTESALDPTPDRFDNLDTAFLGLYSEEEFDRLLEQCGV